MYEKTSSIEFRKYGSTYSEPKNIFDCDLVEKTISTNNKIISNLYYFSDTVYIEIKKGMAYILVGESYNDSLDLFGVHGNLKLKPNMYFNIISMTDTVSFSLKMSSKDSLRIEFLNPPYVYKKISPTINIKEIMAYYYTIKSPNYKFKGERHNMYELTFVDNGTLDTSIDNTSYQLNCYDLIIYGKNQFHTQMININNSCSYLTVLFDMECIDDSLICNKVFHCGKELYNAIRTFAKNISASSKVPCFKDLVLNNFLEIIIRLFQYDYLDVYDDKPLPASHQHFQDELLDKITNYIDKKICEPITIEELCLKFSISRSSLQSLFKNNLDISPKKYINNLKLSRSKLLIRENKYTISEIAFMLGFSSIHYFSRAFTQYYDVTPSEYAQITFK